jgi:four helix bundle protein
LAPIGQSLSPNSTGIAPLLGPRPANSVCANIAEAYRKRRYINHFISKLTDSDGENSETSVWLDFALEYNYLSKEQHIDMVVKSEEMGKIINYMILNPTRFGCKL